MHAVGLSAVLAYCECNDGADPNDDASGNELQNAVPDALRTVSEDSSVAEGGTRTFNHAGPVVCEAPRLLEPAPKRSSKPSGCESTKSHISSKNAESAIAHPKSRLSTM